MELLKERIRREGKVLPGNIIKVDGFLNHRVDTALMSQLADEFAKYFDVKDITMVLTAEASGIPLATVCAQKYGVPMVFAKKAKSDNIEGGLYQSEIFSYTYKKKVTLIVAQEWLGPNDRVLIIDDFMAKGYAMQGLIDIVKAAGAELVGIGVAVEKGFQQAHGAADVFIQHPPVGGQGDAPGVPGEQAGLKLRLQLLDGLADGRLGYKQSLGRGGNVSGLGHFLENAIKLQLHGHNSTSLRKIMRVGLLSAVIISDIFRNATPICISPEDSAFFPISSCFFRGPSV